MSYDSIGNKVMIHRAPEVSRDAGQQQHRTEVTQAQLTEQSLVNVSLSRDQVANVYHSEQANLHREREKRRKQPGQPTKAKDSPAPDDGHHIDIRI